MRISLENIRGKNPSLYARKVLKECELRHPPICEKTVADYLGLNIREFSLEDMPGNERFFGVIKRVFAWLHRKPKGKSRIYVHRDIRLERKRLSVLHECCHFVIPWHWEFDYMCDEKDIDSAVQGRVEREAYDCGSEFLMPWEMFVDDILSLETGISAIEQLSSRYVASLEATAIRYARVHPGICGMVMVEAAENQKGEAVSSHLISARQLSLGNEIPSGQAKLDDTERYPLKVKYFVGSPRFGKYFRHGTGIEEGNSVFEAWASGRQIQDEIPASVFGSSARWAYNAECLPLGNCGKMLVLLWLPDRQLTLDFGKEVVL